MASSTMYKWQLRNFSTMASRKNPGNVLYTDDFALPDSNVKLSIRFMPTNTIRKTSKEYCALQLMLKDLGGEKSVKLEYKLWIENTNGEKLVHLNSEIIIHTFYRVNEGYGWHMFVHKDQMYSPANTFVKHDTIILCCDVRMLKPKVSEDNSKLAVEIQKSEWEFYEQGFKGSCMIKVNGQEFQIDKKKLMAHSPVFESMFKSGTQENNVIQMEDVTPSTVNALIKYLHLHDISNLEGDAYGLYHLAKKYQIDDLQEKCSAILIEGLNSDNLFERMVIAFKHEDPSFKQGVLDYLIGRPENFKQIMISGKWKKLMDDNLEMSHEIINEFFKVMKLD